MWLRCKKGIKSYNWRLTCHEQFENSSRLGVLNDRDPDPHIRVVQSDRLVSKYVMSAWLRFVCVNKRMFSSGILSLEFSFPLEFSILSTGEQTSQMELTGSWPIRADQSELTNKSWPIRHGDRFSGNRLSQALCCADWEEATASCDHWRHLV